MINIEEHLNKLKPAVERAKEEIKRKREQIGYNLLIELSSLCSYLCIETWISEQNKPGSVNIADYKKALSIFYEIEKLVPGTWVERNNHDRIKEIIEYKPELLKELPKHFEEYIKQEKPQKRYKKNNQ